MFEHVPCSQDPSRAISEAREMRFPVPVSFCSTWGGGGGGGGWLDGQAVLIFRKWNILSLTAVSRLPREEILV